MTNEFIKQTVIALDTAVISVHTCLVLENLFNVYLLVCIELAFRS